MGFMDMPEFEALLNDKDRDVRIFGFERDVWIPKSKAPVTLLTKDDELLIEIKQAQHGDMILIDTGARHEYAIGIYEFPDKVKIATVSGEEVVSLEDEGTIVGVVLAIAIEPK